MSDFVTAEQTREVTSSRVGIFLLLLGLVYVAAAGAYLVYYNATQCPYVDAHTCEDVNSGLDKCGADMVFSNADCTAFAHERYPCFCTKCKHCYDQKQLDLCDKSADERETICKAAVPF